MLSEKELLEFQDILSKLDDDIKIDSDYKPKYTKSKKHFFNRVRGSKTFKVEVIDRGKKALPLIKVSSDKHSTSFDVSWIVSKLSLIKKALAHQNI